MADFSSVSSDSDFDVKFSSSVEEEHTSFCSSEDETLHNLALKSTLLKSNNTTTLQDSEALIKARLAEAHPQIHTTPTTTTTTTNLACHKDEEYHRKKREEKEKKQMKKPMITGSPFPTSKKSHPPLFSAKNGLPYSPLGTRQTSEGKELDKRAKQIVKDAFDEKLDLSSFQKTTTPTSTATFSSEPKLNFSEIPDLSPLSSLTPDQLKALGCDCEEEKEEDLSLTDRFTVKSLSSEKEGEMPTLTKYKSGFEDRMRVEMMYKDRIQNSSIQSIMLGDGFLSTNNGWLDRAMGKEGVCGGATVMQHMRKYHPEFYNLLYQQNLIELVTKRKDLVFVIPSVMALSLLDPTAEVTKHILLYHLVIIKGAGVFQNVEDMQQYETLSGDYVQVQNDNGAHYINGFLLKPDINCDFSIYHIPSLLNKSQLLPVSIPDDPTQEDVSDSSDDAGGDGEQEEGEEVMATNNRIKFATLQLGKPSKVLLSSKTKFSFLVQNMNGLKFSSAEETQAHVTSPLPPKETIMKLSIYNTGELFSSYEKNQMQDISRITPDSMVTLTFSPEQQTCLETESGKMTEYLFNNSAEMALNIKKRDLCRGLLGVSLQDTGSEKFSILLCQLSATKTDGNCFVSSDESLLMRFSQDRLESITVNHEKLGKNSTSPIPLDSGHFLEYRLNSELYRTHTDKAKFDTMLLEKGSIGKWIKRKSRKLHEKSKCSWKRFQSIDLRKIPTAYLQKLVTQRDVVMERDFSDDVIIQFAFYDKTCNAKSSSSVKVKKYALTTPKKDNVVIFSFDTSSNYGSTYEGDYHLLEMQIEASPRIVFNVGSGVERHNPEYSYVAKKLSDVYLLTFDPLNGRLKYMYNMTDRTAISRKILQHRL